MKTAIKPHIFEEAPELGKGVCGRCPLRESHEVHSAAPAAPPIPTPRELHSHADDWWRSCAERGIYELAKSGLPFQSYDLELMGVPQPDNPNRWGPLLSHMAAENVIEKVGAAPSKRPSVKGSLCMEWRGTAKYCERAR